MQCAYMSVNVIPDTTCIDLRYHSGSTVCLDQARDVTVTKSAITQVFVLAALEACDCHVS